MGKVKHAFGFILLLVLTGCKKWDTVENEYPNIQTAINAGAVERGWVPSFLPVSAEDIREQHNLDTNEVWLRFSIDKEEQGAIEQFCDRVYVAEIILPRKGVGTWWPESLTRQKSRTSPQMDEYVYYHCENGGAISIEKHGRRFFYWYPTAFRVPDN